MKFSEIIGHEAIKQQLIKSVENNRLSHALMFLGPEGNGALPLALAFAQYLNCEQKNLTDSCGECPSCRNSSKFTHPDIHFSYPVIKNENKPPVSVDFINEWRSALTENSYMGYIDWLQCMDFENKQANITIDECHYIIKTLSLKAFEGNYKIMIMWLPEFLGKNGNTLLKIIEEPPSKTLFIFIANNRETILNTILSRTQIIPIPKLSYDEIISGLLRTNNIENETASEIAMLADGNFNEAMRLLNSENNKHFDDFINWMRACWNPNMIEVFQWVNGIADKGRENIKDFILYALRYLRECYLIAGKLNEMSRMNNNESDFSIKFSKFLNKNNINQIYALLNQSYYHIERNANPKILFFDLSLQIHKLLTIK